MELLNLIKRAAVEAVNANDPMRVWIGTVETEKPLGIRIDQQTVLTEDYLLLARDVTDYVVEMEVDHQTEKMSGGAKDPSFQSHLHQYKGIKPFKVLNALKKGEKVIIVSVQGGQQFVVLDRLGEM